MDRETRTIALDLEVRANGTAKGIRGTAAVFNRSTIIGFFEERIAPGAFDGVLDDDVVGLFNHDSNMVLGRSPDTMSLTADTEALRFDIPELPSSRADVLEAVRRRDVRGNSFSFSIEDDDDDEFIDRTSEGKIPLRIIRRVGRLFDVGPVTFPAYVDTHVSARSLERAAELAHTDEFRARIQRAIESRQFTCPKPFDTLDECVGAVEADVDDPEAFCVAWEQECESNSQRSCSCVHHDDRDERITQLEGEIERLKFDLRMANMMRRPRVTVDSKTRIA